MLRRALLSLMPGSLLQTKVNLNLVVQADPNSFDVDFSTKPPTMRLKAGASPRFVSGEVPTGATDGANRTFVLAHAPAGFLVLFRSGIYMTSKADPTTGRQPDYSISGNTITFSVPSTPQAGDPVEACYTW